MRIPPFRLERFFARHEFTVPFHLCASDCEPWTVGDLLDLEPEARSRFERLRLSYTESAGAPSLRRALAATYRDWDPDAVLVCAAGEEVIFTFMHTALQSGDHVIVQMPAYQSLAEIPAAIGCQVSGWRGDPANGFAPRLDELDGLLQPNTKALVVNFPHSPTGFHPDLGTWKALIAWVAERELLLFSDEAYRGLEYRAEQRLPAACELYPRAVSLGLLSKGYGLPGLRTGWAASQDLALLAGMAQWKDYTTICSSAPSEFLAELAVRHGDTLLARNLRFVGRHLELVEAFFRRHHERFEWVAPKAGPVAFPALRGNVDAELFTTQVRERGGVLLLPGNLFGNYPRRFRIGFGRADLPAGLQRLEETLRAW
jgi:aspartate/methionine/tyrosine aminotransferase